MTLLLEGHVMETDHLDCAAGVARDPWLVHCCQVMLALRKEKGLKLKEIGDPIGLSDSHVSHVLKGTHIPRATTLFQLLRQLGIQLTWPFAPRVPPELLDTVALLARATPKMQAAIRQMLIATDPETMLEEMRREMGREALP